MAVTENINVTADTSQAQAQMRQLSGTMTTSFAQVQVALAGIEMAWSKVSGAVSYSIGLALEYEKSSRKLSGVLRGLGYDAEIYSKILNKQSAELQNLTGISDDVIRNMQAIGLSAGVSAGDLDTLIKASISLANVTDRDVNQVMKAFLQSLKGEIGELRVLLPEIDKMTKAELKRGDAIKFAADHNREALGLLTEGNAGKIHMFATAVGDLAEAFGKVALESLPMTEGIGKVTDALTKFAGMLETNENLKSMMRFLLASGPSALLGGPGMIAPLLAGAGIEGGMAAAAGPLSEPVDLVPLVEPPKPKGRRGGGGKDGDSKKEQGFSAFDFAGFSDIDMLNLEGGEGLPDAFQGAADEAQKELLKVVEWEERVNRLKEKNKKESNDYQIELDKKLAKDQEELARKKHDAELKRIEKNTKDINAAVGIGYGLIETATETFFEGLISGGNIAWEKILMQAMTSIGDRLMVMGFADGAEGAARLARSYGADASGYSLIAIGAAEVAGGTLLKAGSAAIGSAFSAGGGAGAGGGGSYTNQQAQEIDAERAAFIDQVRRERGGYNPTGAAREIKVYVVGGDEEAADAIRSAMQQAAEKGF